jgi:hypothetical protein
MHHGADSVVEPIDLAEEPFRFGDVFGAANEKSAVVSSMVMKVRTSPAGGQFPDDRRGRRVAIGAGVVNDASPFAPKPAVLLSDVFPASHQPGTEDRQGDKPSRKREFFDRGSIGGGPLQCACHLVPS